MTTIQPDNRPIGKKMYLLVDNFKYISKIYEAIVPAGFINDGASVPRWAWSICGLTPDGILRAAAVVHDYNYRYELTSRAFADKLFYNMLVEYGVSKHHAWIAYFAVRIGGKRHFGKISPPNKDKYEDILKEVNEYRENRIITETAYKYAMIMIAQIFIKKTDK